jgi:hypothetical protein
MNKNKATSQSDAAFRATRACASILAETHDIPAGDLVRLIFDRYDRETKTWERYVEGSYPVEGD